MCRDYLLRPLLIWGMLPTLAWLMTNLYPSSCYYWYEGGAIHNFTSYGSPLLMFQIHTTDPWSELYLQNINWGGVIVNSCMLLIVVWLYGANRQIINLQARIFPTIFLIYLTIAAAILFQGGTVFPIIIASAKVFLWGSVLYLSHVMIFQSPTFKEKLSIRSIDI